MKANKQSFDFNLVCPKNQILPVKAANVKLQQQSCGKAYVNCVSCIPLAFQTSKQQLRINYIRGIIQKKVQDPRFNHLGTFPQIQLQPNNAFKNGPGNNSKNPFIKSTNFNVQSSPNIANIQGSINQPFQANNQSFTGNIIPKSNNFLQNQNYKSPFIPNQLQNNTVQNPLKNMFTQNPTLTKQTSFQAQTVPNSLSTGMNYGAQNINQSSNPIFSNNVTSAASNTIPVQGNGVFSAISTSGSSFSNLARQNPNIIVNNTNQGGLFNSPSFGNLSANNALTAFNGVNTQPNIAQTQSQSSFNATQQPITEFGLGGKPASFAGGFNNINQNNQPIAFNQPPNIIQGTLPNQSQPVPIDQNPLGLGTSQLDKNIKQLLQSKPNLWNILALDPNYKYGYNQHGRLYVKSVLQRIIDQNILSEQSLNKVIIEIYKKMYGLENFEKYLESSKKDKQNFSRNREYREYRIDEILSKEFQEKNSESAFPKDFMSLSQDFYRSGKRTSTKFLDVKFSNKQKETGVYQSQRKYFKISRPEKQTQLKVKFVEVKIKQNKQKQTIQNPYSKQQLQTITQNINQIRHEHRKQIMPTLEDLPNIQGFTISPSMETILKFTKFQLLSVPKVIISNQWGSIKFKAPISLYQKIVNECIIINQKSVQIIDQEWKIRDAQITFNKFANFQKLQESQKDQLQDKIESWCERQKFQLIKIDREKGEVVIEI